MRLKRLEDLPAQLAGDLARVYLISGDEPLLVQEAADMLRAAARKQGVGERELFHVESGFDWQTLRQIASSMSLFSSRRLIELRLRSAAPGKDGAAALESWAATATGDDVLLILMPRLDARSQKAGWYTALERVGVHVPIWPVALGDMPRWLSARCRAQHVRLDNEALALLTMHVEGNLLAAAQAVTRLALSSREQPWTAAAILEELGDDARYTPFELTDCVLSGDARQTHRILRTLRLEGAEILALVAILAREFRQLRTLRKAHEEGRLEAAMKEARLFPRRRDLVKTAAQRLPLPLLEGALRDLAIIDQAVKGLSLVEPWDELDRLVLRLAGVRTTPLGLKARIWLRAG